MTAKTAKEEYAQKITELVNKSTDISLLDFILRLLQKGQQA